jgi:hypothetical protein
MMGLSYAAEKYTRARDAMATGHGVLRERLRDAFVYQLRLVNADRDLPAGLREEHRELVERVTRIDGADGRIAATLAQMSGHELHEVAEQVVSMEYRIRSLYQAPPWHYIGRPTALIRMMPERRGHEAFGQGPGTN